MLLDYFKKLYNKYMEAINYLVFGALSVVINVVVYYLCAECLGIDYLLGNFFAWFCSVLFSFVTNKLFVFENQSNSMHEWLSQGIMFVGARILTGCVDMIGMYIWVGKIHIDKMISKYAMNVLVIVLNYVFSKLWIFRKRKIVRKKYMKYLMLTNNSGGLYRFRKDLIERLLFDGHEVYAVTPFDEFVDELQNIGVNLIEQNMDRRGTNLLQEVQLLRAFRSIIKHVQPDHIITYTIKPGIYGGLLASKYRIPYTVNITGLGSAFEKQGFFLWMICTLWRKALKHVEHVLFQNVENAAVFEKHRIVGSDKICILPGSGVNLEDFPFVDYPSETDFIQFLFIGRVMREKGIDELLGAMEQLHQRHPNITLDVVGWCEEDYEERLGQLQARGILHFHGFQKDVTPFIKQAHVFVLPSYHEGMANTLLEAAAMGRPLITSRIHGCMEAARDGETGFLCEARDEQSLVQQMERFIELPYDQKRRMGQLSHEYVADHFDKKKVVQETVEILYSGRIQ